MTVKVGSHLLRRALQANGAFSAVSAVYFLIAAQSVASFLGLPDAATVYATAVMLGVFAAALFSLVARKLIPAAAVWTIIILDVLWVAQSIGLVLSGSLTRRGNWAVAMVADVVLVFAILQFIGLRRTQAATP